MNNYIDIHIVGWKIIWHVGKNDEKKEKLTYLLYQLRKTKAKTY